VKQDGVDLAQEDGILTVTLDRPPANALDAATLSRLVAVFEQSAADRSVGAVVITGAGHTFVAGADIRSFIEHDTTGGAHPSLRLATDLFNLIEVFPKVVIAAINGACLGGGNELALACDIRIASTEAVLGQPEIKLGLVPGWGGMQRLPRLIGRGPALELMLTGRRLSAQEARSIGLVTDVVTADQLAAHARGLALCFAALPPLAIAAIKERVARGASEPQGQAIRDDEWTFNDLLSTEDAQEGLNAFLEKRGPSWKGR
jgi:enoyl-CoA hydratase/carnithine racemase